MSKFSLDMKEIENIHKLVNDLFYLNREFSMKLVDVKKKYVSTSGITKWNDGYEYKIINENIKLCVSNITTYFDSGSLSVGTKKSPNVCVHEISMSYKDTITYLKNIIRKTKAKKILESI